MSRELKNVPFNNRSIDIAVGIRFPVELGDGRKHAALVVITPGSSVKEQIGGNYARKMAERGFVTLVFDSSYQGQSGGDPGDLKDPAARVEDLRCAVDFLTSLLFVDEDRNGAFGMLSPLISDEHSGRVIAERTEF